MGFSAQAGSVPSVSRHCQSPSTVCVLTSIRRAPASWSCCFRMVTLMRAIWNAPERCGASSSRPASANMSMERLAGDRRHILVPGQVEDDRAVTAGGCGLTSNLELLKRVRAQAPDSYILYKPHPDVLAGHRRGAVSDRSCLEYADQIAGDVSIASLIEMVDEIHVNTSLAGFEALLRGKSVVTHGVPFYAGWGLTRDLGPVPSRRSARRTIDELVAATLLLYPRYLDPETGLPCPVEVVVARLSASEKPGGSLVVGMRRLQGKLMRSLRSLVQ